MDKFCLSVSERKRSKVSKEKRCKFGKIASEMKIKGNTYLQIIEFLDSELNAFTDSKYNKKFRPDWKNCGLFQQRVIGWIRAYRSKIFEGTQV
jgi:hypothetical protein